MFSNIPELKDIEGITFVTKNFWMLLKEEISGSGSLEAMLRRVTEEWLECTQGANTAA